MVDTLAPDTDPGALALDLGIDTLAPDLPRLQPSNLGDLPVDVARPRYERNELRPGIVHLGLGSFARAFLGVFNETAIHAGGEPHFGIVGVSLRSPAVRDALAPQRGLYTV